jgi:hypothetical protein
MIDTAFAYPSTTPTLRIIEGGASRRRPATWYERRSMMRGVVGGCPDHWWKPTAPRTAACTCDRFVV